MPESRYEKDEAELARVTDQILKYVESREVEDLSWHIQTRSNYETNARGGFTDGQREIQGEANLEMAGRDNMMRKGTGGKRKRRR